MDAIVCGVVGVLRLAKGSVRFRCTISLALAIFDPQRFGSGFRSDFPVAAMLEYSGGVERIVRLAVAKRIAAMMTIEVAIRQDDYARRTAGARRA